MKGPRSNKLDAVPDRPKQILPADLVNGLLVCIRTQFVPDMESAEWYGSHNEFIKVKVVMWPASFMRKHGFTLPPERYRQIMMEVLNEVKRHGNTGGVRFWPGYLLKCIQEHWKHHWEEYYAEAKAIRNQAERALLAIRARADGAPVADVVGQIAEAQRLLTARRKRKQKPVDRQEELAL